jgi:type II secretory pathway pseudopilin PulG
MTYTRSTRAVTLVELLIVMSIITMLAAMLGVLSLSVTRRTSEDRAKATIYMLNAVLELYKNDCGIYPDAINHNPQRGMNDGAAVMIGDIEPGEGDGTYPWSTEPCSKTRKLYWNVPDETKKNAGNRRCSQLVAALCSRALGWGNPQFFEHFKENSLNNTGQLIDSWGHRYFYMSADAYRYWEGTNGCPGGGSPRPGGGATTAGRGEGTFYNAGHYQIYSAGINGKTYPDFQNRGGTDEDDITNW